MQKSLLVAPALTVVVACQTTSMPPEERLVKVNGDAERVSEGGAKKQVKSLLSTYTPGMSSEFEDKEYVGAQRDEQAGLMLLWQAAEEKKMLGFLSGGDASYNGIVVDIDRQSDLKMFQDKRRNTWGVALPYVSIEWIYNSEEEPVVKDGRWTWEMSDDVHTFTPNIEKRAVEVAYDNQGSLLMGLYNAATGPENEGEIYETSFAQGVVKEYRHIEPAFNETVNVTILDEFESKQDAERFVSIMTSAFKELSYDG